MCFQYDSNGIPLGFIYNGIQYFYITNQMGDVIAIIDLNEDMICEYVYDEWGKNVTVNYIYGATEQQIAATNANPLRYRGYYYDAETEYYYLQSRYYDPSICRFINADIPEVAGITKEISNGTNLFAYCNNDPINMRDTSGEIPVWVVYAIAGAALFGGVTYIIGRALGITGRALTILTASLSAVGATVAAILGVKFLAKISPKLAKWAKTIAKNTKVLKPSYKHRVNEKTSFGGVILFDAFKIMLHPPHHNQHNYFHIQIEVKLPGIRMSWIKFRIRINPSKWIR